MKTLDQRNLRPPSSAEDTIIAKLEWATQGESERQLRDVAGILGIQADALDREYLRQWIGVLGVEDAWKRALELLN